MSSEETKEWLTCSYDNCGKEFAKEFFSSGMPQSPVKDSNKFHAIMEGLMQTRLFCIKCTTNHARIVCMNSKIPIVE
jgi:hypothetical protein